jgi:hypothetical protein
MPKKLDICIKKVRAKIRKGDIPKTYKLGKKRIKTNEYAICKSKIKARDFNRKHWGKPNWGKE